MNSYDSTVQIRTMTIRAMTGPSRRLSRRRLSCAGSSGGRSATDLLLPHRRLVGRRPLLGVRENPQGDREDEQRSTRSQEGGLIGVYRHDRLSEDRQAGEATEPVSYTH